jgi:hypothetical protein
MNTAMCSQDEYVGLNESCRRTGRSIQFIQRQAIIGNIRTLVELGRTPRYHSADLKKYEAARSKVCVA